jgi:hypothetical protein
MRTYCNVRIESTEWDKDGSIFDNIVHPTERRGERVEDVVSDPPEQTAICRGKEGINSCDVAKGVNGWIFNQRSQGSPHRLGYVAHPFARMAKTSQSRGQLWGPPKTACPRADTLEKDPANAAQCGPLHHVILCRFTWVHNPITVSHELLKRIRIEELDGTNAKTEHLAEGEPLGSVEGLPLMQSRTHISDAIRVLGNCRWLAHRDNVISADTSLRSQRCTSPAVDQGKDSKRQGSPHQYATGEWHVYDPTSAKINGSERTCNLRLVLLWEVTKAVSDIMLRVADAEGIGGENSPVFTQTSSRHTAEHGMDSIMKETVSGFSEVCRKEGLSMTQSELVAAKVLYEHLVVNRLDERTCPTVSFEDRRPNLLANHVSKGENTRRRDGYDPRLRALFSNHRSLVCNTRLLPTGKPINRSWRGEFAESKQASTCLPKLGVLHTTIDRPSFNPRVVERVDVSYVIRWVLELLNTAHCVPGPSEQVVGSRIPRNKKPKLLVEGLQNVERGLSLTIFIRRLERPAQLGAEETLEVPVVTSLGTRPTTDSVLTRRRKSYATFSQLTLLECGKHVPLQLMHRCITGTSTRGECNSMVVKRLLRRRSRRLWKSPRTPCEGKCTTRLSLRNLSEPTLQASGYFLHFVDLAVRECNVTNGHADRLHTIANPVNSARFRVAQPLPEYPATILLRNSTGNKTGPNCLPGSSLVVDYTPMGLRVTTLFSGVARGTYNTAKKKRR